nr:hypothetical protein [uncultured Psychrobacter sp.]
MEPIFSFASISLASILASLPAGNESASASNITTHISPAIAGQWEIELNNSGTMSNQSMLDSLMLAESASETTDGVLDQSERRTITMTPSNTQIPATTGLNSSPQASSNNQCREIYNFGADNEMWAVSGKEWTYSRYLVSHLDEGLPIIAIKTIYDNNEVDCSGNQIDQSDETLIAFLDHKDNQMQWCADPEGLECFMTFRRVMP